MFILSRIFTSDPNPTALSDIYRLFTTIVYLAIQVACFDAILDCIDVASDVGVNLCNVKSCLNSSNSEIFTDKRGDLPCVNISKHTCLVQK